MFSAVNLKQTSASARTKTWPLFTLKIRICPHQSIQVWENIAKEACPCIPWSFHHQFLDRQKRRFIWMRKSFLSCACALCRCIEQCSKLHCASARLQGMRLFLENDVTVKYSECAHPPPTPPPPCSLGLTGRLQQQQHPTRRKEKKNRAKLGGYRGLGGERQRYKKI